jgi:murein DD-endopeptidase MepM/ murein hydrolase activator NlpD
MSSWLNRSDSGRPRTGAVAVRRTGTRARRLVALALALTLATVGSIAATDQPAYAVEYSTWNDVIAARQSEAATVEQIEVIKGMLEGLRAEVERTQADAIAKGEAAEEANQKFQEGVLKADKLQAQADAAGALAEQSKQQAGEIVAQQYRSGSGDVSADLFVNASKADDLLYSFGLADKFTQQTAGIYEKAVTDQNTAGALTKQAKVAQGLLEQLRDAADAASQAAQDAADAAADAVAEQEANQADLDAQLVVLSERRAVVEADYQVGEQVRAAAAAAAAAAAEAARLAAAAAGGAIVGQNGWYKPTYGGITSGYGMRLNPYSHVWRLHAGTDMSSGCGKPIYAAHAGTVSYAAWLGSYGNFILIDNGDGIQTGYGHIVNGGTLVSRGQQVEGGQLIAYVGTTGGSTGCHLHYEVRINGVATDAVPFMRNQGVTLG